MKPNDVKNLRYIAHYLVDLIPDDEIGWVQKTLSPGVYEYTICGAVKSPLHSDLMHDSAVKHGEQRDAAIATLTAEKEAAEKRAEQAEYDCVQGLARMAELGGIIQDCEARLAEAEKVVEAAKALIKEGPWYADDGYSPQPSSGPPETCCVCRNWRLHGHGEGCEWAALSAALTPPDAKPDDGHWEVHSDEDGTIHSIRWSVPSEDGRYRYRYHYPDKRMAESHADRMNREGEAWWMNNRAGSTWRPKNDPEITPPDAEENDPTSKGIQR